MNDLDREDRAYEKLKELRKKYNFGSSTSRGLGLKLTILPLQRNSAFEWAILLTMCAMFFLSLLPTFADPDYAASSVPSRRITHTGSTSSPDTASISPTGRPGLAPGMTRMK